MKFRQIKHLVLSTILIVGVILSIQKISYAPVTEKFVQNTDCCLEGTVVGTSNDCSEGDGSCVDHNCATGETEKKREESCPS